MNSALLALREAMQTQGYAACLIPTADPHLSEYLCPHWQARVWLSGFTGSAGTLVVTADFAGLWADSRYWEQAEHELAGSGVTLMKVQTAASQEHLQWLANTLKPGERLAIDGDVLSSSAARALEALLGTSGARIDYGVDLPGQVWADRPAQPASRVYQHMAPWAGETRASKLARVRAAMRDAGAGRAQGRDDQPGDAYEVAQAAGRGRADPPHHGSGRRRAVRILRMAGRGA